MTEVWAVAMNQRDEVRLMDVHPSLVSPGGRPGHGTPVVFVKAKRAQSVDDDESWKEGGVAPTLNAFDNNGDSRATVIAFGHTQGLDAQPSTVHTPTLRREGGGAAVSAPTLGVRRLTPRECERLMGWPDDHTRYTADGKEIADSSRYRMCGNGVDAPVARYVAECVERVLRGTEA